MKKSSFVIFFSVVFSVYGLVNLYIFVTGITAMPDKYASYYTAAYIFLSLSYIAGRFLERKFLNRLSSFFVWTGSFWLAAMVYFLLAALLTDITRIAVDNNLTLAGSAILNTPILGAFVKVTNLVSLSSVERAIMKKFGDKAAINLLTAQIIYEMTTVYSQ